MKTLTSALLMSMAVLSAGAYASQNIEPNNVPFQASTASKTRPRAAPR